MVPKVWMAYMVCMVLVVRGLLMAGGAAACGPGRHAVRGGMRSGRACGPGGHLLGRPASSLIREPRARRVTAPGPGAEGWQVPPGIYGWASSVMVALVEWPS